MYHTLIGGQERHHSLSHRGTHHPPTLSHSQITTMEGITNASTYHMGNTTLFHFYKNNQVVRVRTEHKGIYIVYVHTPSYSKWKGQLIEELQSKLEAEGFQLEKI